MEIVTDLTLDLKRPNINTIAHAKQGDKLSRYINAALVDGAQPWTPPAGTMTTVRFKKPDGHAGFYDVDENGDPAVVFTGNVAKITLAEQAITVPGNVIVELTMYNGDGERLSSFYFIVVVEESALTDAEIESTDYFSILTVEIAAVLAKIDSVAGIEAEADSIPFGEETYVIVTGGTGADDPYHLHFYIEGAKPMTAKGTYDPATTYNKLDFVLYNGSSYVAMRDGIRNVTPGTSVQDWQLVAAAATVVVSSQDIKYAAQNAADYTGTPPSSGWSATIPTAGSGNFLWTRVITTYSDTSTSTAYSVAKNGVDGSGAVASVNDVGPDGTGNVTLDAGDIDLDKTAPTPQTIAAAIAAVNTNIATKAEKAVYTATLNTTWSGSTAPFTKAQTINGILATDYPIVDLVPSTTFATAQSQEEAWAKIVRIAVSANTLTFYASEKPTVSLPIKVMCVR